MSSVHNSDVKKSSWRLKSRATRLCVQELVRANNKENVKALDFWLSVRGIHPPVTGGVPLQRASNVEIVTMPWRHYDVNRSLQAPRVLLMATWSGVIKCKFTRLYPGSAEPIVISGMCDPASPLNTIRFHDNTKEIDHRYTNNCVVAYHLGPQRPESMKI